MNQITVQPPGLYPTTGHVPGILAGNLLHTSGIVARDGQGAAVHVGDVAAQAEQVYAHLDAILADAGATWDDVASYHCYVTRPEHVDAVRAVHATRLAADAAAGTTVVAPLVDPVFLVEVDLIAHLGAPKASIVDVAGLARPVAAPHAMRVGDTVYVSGRHGVAAGGADPFVVEIEALYGDLDRLVEHCGLDWNRLAFAHTYVTGNDVIGRLRDVRYRHFPVDRVAQTAVVTGLVEPGARVVTAPIFSTAEIEPYRVPGVSISAGVAHATRAGNVLYVQGQIAREPDGTPIGAGDIEAQAEGCYAALDLILEAAGAGWADVVRVKSYAKEAALIPSTRAARDARLAPGTYTSTAVQSGFFNPDYLLEVELVAVIG